MLGTPAPPTAPVHPVSRFTWPATFAAIPFLVVAFHWRAATPGMAFAWFDIRNFFIPVRDAVAASLRSGSLPLWQRGMFMGYPLVADPQAAVFAPATWLTLPWESPRALTLATLLHLTIAGWGMAAWMRQRGLRPASALLAAILFALGGKQTLHILHWPFAATMAWWPWIFVGIEGFAVTGRSRWLLLTAVSTALCWTGGAPQMAYMGTVVAGLYALRVAFDVWSRRRGDAVWVVAMLPVGVALASILLFPAAELASVGSRSQGLVYEFADSWRWPDAWGLALLVLPRAYTYGPWGLNLWEATGYVGFAALALAVAAPRHRRGVLLFAALAVAGPWIALGSGAAIDLHHLLFQLLPGYGAFRAPNRALLVSLFAVSGLAAEGLEALRRDPSRAREGRSIAVLLVLALLVVVIPAIPGFPFDPAPARRSIPLMLAIAAGGILGVALLAWGKRGSLAAAVVVSIVFGETVVLFARTNVVLPVAFLSSPLAGLAPAIPASPAPRRISVVGKLGVSTNAPLRHGWEGTSGYGPMYVEAVRDLIGGTRTGMVHLLPVTDPDILFPRGEPTSPLWPLLATPIVVSTTLRPGLPVLAGITLDAGHFAHSAAALPRVYWTG